MAQDSILITESISRKGYTHERRNIQEIGNVEAQEGEVVEEAITIYCTDKGPYPTKMLYKWSLNRQKYQILHRKLSLIDKNVKPGVLIRVISSVRQFSANITGDDLFVCE